MSKHYTEFPIRTTRPSANDPYLKCYIREANGGWNASILGSPTDPLCNVLSNCVGYASGRFSEIYCQITGKAGGHYKYFNGNPPSVPERVKQFYPWLVMDTLPHPGDLIAWQDHVAICEQVISDNEILISDSAYNGAVFRSYKINNSNGQWGRSKFICFVHNDAVKEWEEPDPVVTDPVERDTTVNQVQATMDKYSNVRLEPVSGKVIGQLAAGYYNVIDTAAGGGYTWYKVAEDNWVAGTIHITYLPKAPEKPLEYPINKAIPAIVTHSIPDYACAGDEIDLNVEVAAGYVLNSIKIDDEVIENSTYIMPEHEINVEISVQKRNPFYFFFDFFKTMLRFIKFLFNAN